MENDVFAQRTPLSDFVVDIDESFFPNNVHEIDYAGYLRMDWSFVREHFISISKLRQALEHRRPAIQDSVSSECDHRCSCMYPCYVLFTATDRCYLSAANEKENYRVMIARACILCGALEARKNDKFWETCHKCGSVMRDTQENKTWSVSWEYESGTMQTPQPVGRYFKCSRCGHEVISPYQNHIRAA